MKDNLEQLCELLRLKRIPNNLAPAPKGTRPAGTAGSHFL